MLARVLERTDYLGLVNRLIAKICRLTLSDTSVEKKNLNLYMGNFF